MRYLLVGPCVPPYNGQAVAFTTVTKSFHCNERLIIDTAKTKYGFINTLITIFLTIYYFLFFKFNVVYFTSSRSKFGFIKDFPLLILSRWLNKKIVNHLHGADFKQFYNKSGTLKPFISYTYKGINTSIVLLDNMKNQYSNFPKMNKVTVSNCYSKEMDVSERGITKKERQILFLSNLMSSKGILEFLDACNVLLKNNEEIKVKIAGKLLADNYMNVKTISKSFYEKYYILKEIFQKRIEYLGIVNGDEKYRLLYESSIFVLPSYYPSEAYPISIIEAMRAGNAIVTTNHNYLPYIVKETNGIIIKSKSSEEIINSVEKLFGDNLELEKIQNNNMKEAKQKYSQDRYITEIKKIICFQ